MVQVAPWSRAPADTCSIGHAVQDLCGCPRGINTQATLSCYRLLVARVGAVRENLFGIGPRVGCMGETEVGRDGCPIFPAGSGKEHIFRSCVIGCSVFVLSSSTHRHVD